MKESDVMGVIEGRKRHEENGSLTPPVDATEHREHR